MSDKLSKYAPEGISWLRAIVGSIPGVGSALDHLIFDKADAIRARNMEAAIASMSAQIESLKESQLDKDWFASDEALAAFKLLADKVAFEPDPAKIDAIGRVVGTFGSIEHAKDPNKLSVVEHLSRLSAVQIKLLALVSRVAPQKRTVTSGGLEQTGTAIWLQDIVAALNKGKPFWPGTLAINEELEVLESYNTLRRVQFMGPSEPAYALTELGKRAASYAKAASP